MDKMYYEAPDFAIDRYELSDVLASSDPTDWIPDTDGDDEFGDL